MASLLMKSLAILSVIVIVALTISAMLLFCMSFNVSKDEKIRFELISMGCGEQLNRHFNLNSYTNHFPFDNAVLLKCDPELKDFDAKDESTYYLKWIIDNYDRLRSQKSKTFLLFVHAHEHAWHYQSLHKMLRTFFENKSWKTANYGALTCRINAIPAATPGALSKIGINGTTIWNHIYQNTSLHGQYREKTRYPCCGTFFMNKDFLFTRSKDEYRQIRQNIFNFNKDVPVAHQHRVTGRVLEGSWHVLFTDQWLIADTCNHAVGS